MKAMHSFKRFYGRVHEGIYPNAFLAYGKRPFERFMGYKKAFHRYQHTLIIDLYFVAIRFDWSDSDAKVEELRRWEEDQYLASFKARQNS